MESNNTATFDFTNLGAIGDIPSQDTSKEEIVIEDISIEEPKVVNQEEIVPQTTEEEIEKPVTEKTTPSSSEVKEILKKLNIHSFIDIDGENETVVNIDDIDLDLDTAVNIIKANFEVELESLKEKSISVEDIDNDRKEIIDFIAKGGDPKKLIELQSDLEDVRQYDLDDEKDAEELIRKYYSYKPDSTKEEVETMIAGAKAQGTLTKMAEIASDKITAYVENLKEAEKENIERLAKERKENFKAYVKKFKEAVKNLGYTDKQYQKIVDFGTKTVKRKLNDGSEIEVFEMDETLGIIRNNAEEAVELARFVLDKEMYLKKEFEKREIELKTKLSKQIKISRALNSNSANTTKTQFEKNNIDTSNLLEIE